MNTENFSNFSPETEMDLMDMLMQIEKLDEFSKLQESQSSFSPAPQLSTTFQFPHSFSLTLSATQEEALLQPMQLPLFYGSELTEASRRASVAAMRELVFRIAALQPIHIDPESVRPPKRRNLRISTDPQSVAARHRRERISERIRILQRLVPGGTKMDTASMLDEAINYVKFLKIQVQTLEDAAANHSMATDYGGYQTMYNIAATIGENSSAQSSYECPYQQAFASPNNNNISGN